MYLWAKTIPQAELTLNLLRGSRINPQLSAWEQLHGRYDYNATPIAPPGTKCLVHVKKPERKTWDPYALDGWYIGPALHSYRCYIVYIPATNGTRITNTLTWLPRKYTMPVATPADLIRAAAEDMREALLSDQPNTFISHLPPSQHHYLQELTEVLTNIANTADIQPQETVLQDPTPTPRTVTFAPDVAQHDANTRRSTTKHPKAPSQRVAGTPPSQRVATQPAPAQRVAKPNGRRRPRNGRRRSRRNQRTSPRTRSQAALSVTTETLNEKTSSQTVATETTETRNEKTPNIFNSETVPSHAPQPKGYAYKAVNPDTGELAEYKALLQSSAREEWSTGFCNEVGRLFQGYKDIKGTDTCKFIHKKEIPQGRTATYIRVVVADRPRKVEKCRVRLTVGGDRVDYPGEVSTKTSDLITAKLLFNSVISTPGSKFMSLDIKDFYLNNELPRKEYARIHLSLIPQDIIEQYNLNDSSPQTDLYISRYPRECTDFPKPAKSPAISSSRASKPLDTTLQSTLTDFSNTKQMALLSALSSTTLA